MRIFLVIFGVLAAGLGLAAQSFDAASIKATRESTVGQGFIGMQPGRFMATEATVREMAAIAFGVTQDRIVGGPPWMASARFSITATMSGDATQERAQAMLRQLLADRFGLQEHREQREMPVYALTVLRGDGRLGQWLRPSKAECAPPTPFIGRPAGEPGAAPPAPPPPPPPPPPGAGSMRPIIVREGKLRCPSMFFPGGVSGRAMPISELVIRLANFSDRPIVDRTNLRGEFDIDITYQFELPPGAGIAPWTAGAPALFTAVQDQLGLKLEATRAPFEVVVIDRLAQPSEN
jgi:uncharacterized protein (TIGR03435 family)